MVILSPLGESHHPTAVVDMPRMNFDEQQRSRKGERRFNGDWDMQTAHMYVTSVISGTEERSEKQMYVHDMHHGPTSIRPEESHFISLLFFGKSRQKKPPDVAA